MLENDQSANNNYVSIVILVSLVSVTLTLGLFGYSSIYVVKPNTSFPIIVKWFDVLYETLNLFSLSSSPSSDATKHWAISIARFTAVCSVFYSIALAATLALRNWIKSNITVRFSKRHYIICGLNESSSFLIDDLLKQQAKVVVIEEDHTNPLNSKYKSSSATIVLGNADSLETLLKCNLLKASKLVAMTGNDLNNLNVLRTIVRSDYSPKLECYIGIDNVMSYKLFEPSAFYSISNIKKLSQGLLINVFNLNELAAIDLVQSMQLGRNADTVSKNATPVKVLLISFNRIGEAILRELLLLAHFANQVKVQIIIMSNEENDFFESHHQVKENANGRGLDLWDIEFVGSTHQFTNPSDFNHIIACDTDENIALKDILRIYDLCTLKQERETDTSTTFHYYNKQGHNIQHKQIQSFGSMQHIASYSQLIDSEKEVIAKRSHEMYAKSKLNIDTHGDKGVEASLEKYDQLQSNSGDWLNWVNQPLFKRRSNFTEKRHIPIKLLALGNDFPEKLFSLSVQQKTKTNIAFLPYIDQFDDLNKALIQNWVNYITEKLSLSESQVLERFDAMAQCEHARWNAFHIVNNWRYGEQKNEDLKTHDCLLSWDDLKIERPDTIKYDYKNVYHIPETLAATKDVKRI